jgi:sugar O-acyltransferase (sialic acid O-acetyltransferase NeuD family)
MRPVVILGVGEFAQLAHYYLSKDSPRKVGGFTVDDAYVRSSEFRGLPVVPFERVQESFPPDQFDLLVAIGYTDLNAARARKCADAKARGYRLASYVSTRASVWQDLALGENCFIMEGNLIQPFVAIGSNVIIWCGSVISHHVEIADNCFIASQVTVSGGAKIGTNCFIGVNATIREHVTIGRNCIIGAGALILKDTPAETGYVAAETRSAGIPSNRLKSLL